MISSRTPRLSPVSSMKTNLGLLLAVIVSLPLCSRAAEEKAVTGRKADLPPDVPPAEWRSEHDEATRFIFHSVLEGLYEDGLSTEDVDQILLRKEKQSYFHFIYACPICQASIWALETYRSRPKQFYGLKSEASTFGPGLSPTMSKRLHSDDGKVRLGVINELMKEWMDRRMKMLNLPPAAHAKLLEALEKKRKEGMEVLQSFRRGEHGPNFGVEQAAPAYVDLEECAVCNAAVGKPMKLPEKKRK